MLVRLWNNQKLSYIEGGNIKWYFPPWNIGLAVSYKSIYPVTQEFHFLVFIQEKL